MPRHRLCPMPAKPGNTRRVSFLQEMQMEMLARRFGNKIKLPPTIQIKREILLRWLKDQTDKEAAEVRKDRVENQLGVGAKAGQ